MIDKFVRPEPTIQIIASRSAVQYVISRSSVNLVVAGATAELVCVVAGRCRWRYAKDIAVQTDGIEAAASINAPRDDVLKCARIAAQILGNVLVLCGLTVHHPRRPEIVASRIIDKVEALPAARTVIDVAADHRVAAVRPLLVRNINNRIGERRIVPVARRGEGKIAFPEIPAEI